MLKYQQYIEKHLSITARSGDEFYGLCPFHHDTNPSFYINGKNGLWLCHACGVKGNFDQLQSQLGGNFEVSTESIRDRLSDMRSELDHPTQEHMKIYPEAWLTQFRHPHEYFDVRGISKMTQEAFQVGYDQFWNAVTIPLRNQAGSLLGVVRRRLEEGGPKYSYPLGFKAADNLFASWKIDGEPMVALVEGTIDAMACWDAGIPALALYGARISPKQIKLLNMLNISTVVIMTDNDEAGINAAQQIVTALEGVSWRIPREWPEDAKDPGDMTDEMINQLFRDAIPLWHLN